MERASAGYFDDWRQRGQVQTEQRMVLECEIRAGQSNFACGNGGNDQMEMQRPGKQDDPDGIRTRVAALKGPCPRPLDDGAGPPGMQQTHLRRHFRNRQVW